MDTNMSSVSTPPSESSKLFLFSYLEMVEGWIKLNLSNEYAIALMVVDIGERDEAFWENVPYLEKAVFSSDVIILRCGDLIQQQRIMKYLDTNFVAAYAFEAGLPVRSKVYWPISTNKSQDPTKIAVACKP